MTKNCLSRSISQEPYIIWLSFMVQICKMIICQGVFFSVKILIFQVVKGWKGNKWPEMSKIYVCCTLYCRSHISYDLHLLYTCMYKRIISPGIFFIFFKILIFKVISGGGKRAKNGPEWQKVFVCLTLYLRNHTSYDCDFWCTCFKLMMPPANFFIFQNFDFWVFSGDKGQKWPKITNLSLFCSIIWGTINHIIKILIMIPAGVFRYFVFKNTIL